MADAIVINKADGSNKEKADLARNEYKNALHLFPANLSGWIVPVEMCSALENTGISEIWEIVEKYRSYTTTKNDYFYHKRREQMVQTMYDSIDRQLKDRFYGNDVIKEKIIETEKLVLDGRISAYQAAADLLKASK